MGLTKKWDIERTWGSHQALLKATLEVLKPQSAVECGCGNYSTPFLRGVPNLITIEHDPRWASQIRHQYSPLPTHLWFVKEFQANNSTRINELPPGEFDRITEYYKWAGTQIKPFDLLFSDTFTACRVPSVLELGNKAKFIIIHDLEPPGPEVYEWGRLDEFFHGWYKYIHKPLGHVGHGHQIPWTGIYSKAPIDSEALSEGMREESERLWNDFTPLVEMENND
jgi:hypothetical protein